MIRATLQATIFERFDAFGPVWPSWAYSFRRSGAILEIMESGFRLMDVEVVSVRYTKTVRVLGVKEK